MTPEKIIATARAEWCAERSGVRGLSQETDHTPACPPKVVAALLDVLASSRAGADPWDSRDGSAAHALAAIGKGLRK